MYRDEIDELYSEICELEVLADIFKAYFLYKSEDGISQKEFNFQIDFFVINFCEKIGELKNLLCKLESSFVELNKFQKEVDNDEKS